MDEIQMPGASRRGGSASKKLSPARLVPAAAPHSEIAGREAGEGEVDQWVFANHTIRVDLANQIAEIREQWRRRQAWHRAEKSLTLQAKALCRRLAEGGDKAEADRIYKAALGKGQHPLAAVAFAAFFPLTEARDGIERHRKAVEKRLIVLAKGLPVTPWVEATRGVGLLSLAAIVGEAGDLGGYANPAKLWKRLGLAVMPDGTRQRRIGGVDAIEHGYSPGRRSVVWNIGACIVKAGGPLKAVYDARKLYELERGTTKAHATIGRSATLRSGSCARSGASGGKVGATIVPLTPASGVSPPPPYPKTPLSGEARAANEVVLTILRLLSSLPTMPMILAAMLSTSQ